MKPRNVDEIGRELERRRRHEGDEALRVDAVEDERIAKATQRLVESTYLGLDDLEAAHHRSDGRHVPPR